MVGAPDSLRDREDEAVRLGVAPLLKVVSAHPDDVRELRVALPEVAAVGVGLRGAVGLKCLEPAAGLDRIEEHHHPVLAREPNHGVDPCEVARVRRREIVRLQERLDVVVRASVGSSGRVLVAEEVDPERVEAERLPVGDVGLRVLQREVHDHRLRRITDDQERPPALVDQVAPCRSNLERVRHVRARPGLRLCGHRSLAAE